MESAQHQQSDAAAQTSVHLQLFMQRWFVRAADRRDSSRLSPATLSSSEWVISRRSHARLDLGVGPPHGLLPHQGAVRLLRVPHR